MNPTITPEQSRTARRFLGLTQAQTIEQGGVSSYKLKQFEAGSFLPDSQFLQDLRGFYEEQGYTFTEAAAPEPSNAGAAPQAPQTFNPSRYLRISPELADEVVGRIFDRMDGNDKEIMARLPQIVESNFIGDGYKATSEKAVQEFYGLAAENYLLFRLLQGRNIIAPCQGDDDKKTVGGLVALSQASEFFDITEQCTAKSEEAEPTEEEEL